MTDTTTSALELQGIGVTVADGDDTLTILDGVDLSVAPGEVVMLTGASGSGKSTLLAVAGLLRSPDGGRVKIAGIDTAGMGATSLAHLRNQRLGLVFQSSNLLPSLTAAEQLQIVAHIAGELDDEARERAAGLLEAVGLAGRVDRLPSQLSGGERQRVGIARALMNEPDLLIADEPTASLDDARGRAVMAMLVEQARLAGTAALIVTHNPDQVSGFDRHLHLESGRVRQMVAA